MTGGPDADGRASLIAPALPPPAGAIPVTLQPSTGDSQLSLGAATTNFGTATTIQVASQSGSQNKRILVKFDLSSIPANATINSANLTLFMTTAPSNNRTYNAHRMTRDWTESQVTWNIAQTGTNSTTAGGDYNGTATTSTTTATTNNVSLTWNIQADVQAWVNGTSNYGTLIKDGTESSATARTATFASEENATSANRPQLVIDYTAPFTATLPGGSAVTMNEPSTLNFTVTNGNLTTTQSISNVTFALPYTVADGTPPPGWKGPTSSTTSSASIPSIPTTPRARPRPSATA